MPQDWGKDEVMIETQSSPTSTFEIVQWHVDAQARGFRDWSLWAAVREAHGKSKRFFELPSFKAGAMRVGDG